MIVWMYTRESAVQLVLQPAWRTLPTTSSSELSPFTETVRALPAPLILKLPDPFPSSVLSHVTPTVVLAPEARVPPLEEKCREPLVIPIELMLQYMLLPPELRIVTEPPPPVTEMLDVLTSNFAGGIVGVLGGGACRGGVVVLEPEVDPFEEPEDFGPDVEPLVDPDFDPVVVSLPESFVEPVVDPDVEWVEPEVPVEPDVPDEPDDESLDESLPWPVVNEPSTDRREPCPAVSEPSPECCVATNTAMPPMSNSTAATTATMATLRRWWSSPASPLPGSIGGGGASPAGADLPT
jgi:hypothetical protein